MSETVIYGWQLAPNVTYINNKQKISLLSRGDCEVIPIL